MRSPLACGPNLAGAYATARFPFASAISQRTREATMEKHDLSCGEQAIRALIGDHFESMKWTPDTRPDWPRFSAEFLPDAVLVPSARPAMAKTLQAFIDRMNGVSKAAFGPSKSTRWGCSA